MMEPTRSNPPDDTRSATPVSVRVILLSIALAVLAGWLGGTEANIFGLRFYDLYVFVGDLFLNALKMLVVPLVVAAMISGIGSASDSGGLGRLGLKTLTYYLTTSMLAILTGLLFVNLLQPGVIQGFVPPSGSVESVAKAVEGRSMGDLTGMLHQFFPPNIIQAAADGQMLGLITFSLLYGLFMTRIEKGAAQVQRDFWQGVYQVMLRMTDFVLFFAPIGVFALVAKVVAASGLDAMRPMAGFMLTVLLALGFHMLITLPLLLRLVARVSPLRYYRAMTPALLTAFSTASSAATLPVTIDCVEKGAGVSSRTASFVLPLGSTVNMDGTALYEGVVVLFIAQLYGVELSMLQQFSVLMLALMTSVGVAGIPAASLVAITLILTSLGLPLEALGLILVVDRLLDMSRTTVNVFSDSVGAVLIARIEGEEGVLGETAYKKSAGL